MIVTGTVRIVVPSEVKRSVKTVVESASDSPLPPGSFHEKEIRPLAACAVPKLPTFIPSEAGPKPLMLSNLRSAAFQFTLPCMVSMLRKAVTFTGTSTVWLQMPWTVDT